MSEPTKRPRNTTRRSRADAASTAGPDRPSPAGTTAMKVAQGGAIVRMYCTGLGDCFLIGLPKNRGEVGHVMIDCGVWKGTPGASDWMRMIMAHIRDTVGAEGIDVLVVTHPHWDHVSGFGQAKAIFDEIPVKEVWLPWTEDPADSDARRLAMQRQFAIQAAVAASVRLRAVADRARAARLDDEADTSLGAARDIDQLLKFVGRTPPDDVEARDEARELLDAGLKAAAPNSALGLGLGELAAAPGTDDLLGYVKDRVSRPKFLRPSNKPVPASQFPGVQIFALGPPTDPKLLVKDDPSKGPGKSEVFARLVALAAAPTDSADRAHGRGDRARRRRGR